MSQPNPYRSVILSGASADESMGARDVSSFSYVSIYLTGTGTISAGAITIAEADSPNSPTWSAIGSAVDAVDVADGVTKAVHIAAGQYGAIQVRISTAIVDGSITAVMRAI